MPNIQEIVTAISERAKGRYEFYISDTVELVSPVIDIQFSAVKLKRLNRDKAGWRTILITALPYDVLYIKGAFRWAADVRDMLAEPQTADLYMFMLIDGIASEDAARLETDDQFCRKVVMRDREDIDSFLDRSFLAALAPTREGDDISDPLLASLNSLRQAHTWVEPHIDAWREILLSQKPTDEIVAALRAEVYGSEDPK